MFLRHISSVGAPAPSTSTLTGPSVRHTIMVPRSAAASPAEPRCRRERGTACRRPPTLQLRPHTLGTRRFPPPAPTGRPDASAPACRTPSPCPPPEGGPRPVPHVIVFVPVQLGPRAGDIVTPP